MTALLPSGLWRRSRWNARVGVHPTRPPTYEVAVLGVLIVWNLLANVALPESGALPLSAVAVTVLMLIARRADVSWDYLGFRRGTWTHGLQVGAVALGLIAVTIVAAAAVPASREFFADDRFVGEGTSEMVYATFVRIPIATALAEEIAFRGVVLGLLLLWMTPLRAIVVSSVLFGVWHVLPAIAALETSDLADVVPGALDSVGAVIGQVLITGVAGFGFAFLRFRGNSVVSPVVAHWGLNGIAYFAGWLIVRSAWV